MVQQPNDDDHSWPSEKWSSQEDSSITESCPIDRIETAEDSDLSDLSYAEQPSSNETFKTDITPEDDLYPEKYTDETVAVKFHVNYEDKTDELFTKAFNRNVTIESIKSELTSFLQIPQNHILIEKDDRELYDDTSLAKLGVPVLGTVQLDVKLTPVSACKLNKELIYGHIPTLDVITVSIQQNKHFVKHLVVEIEDEQCQKPWLGGYRHRITRTDYHHAQTQTYSLKTRNDNAYVTRSTQATSMESRQTNTSSDKSVQIASFMFAIPSQTDRIVTAKSTRCFATAQTECEQILDANDPNKSADEVLAENRNSSSDDNSVRSPAVGDPIRKLKHLRNEIEKWNATQNAFLNNSPNDREAAMRRTLIINQTVKFINRLNQFKSKLFDTRSADENLLFDMYTKPNTFVSKTGSRISMRTVFNQKAEKLKELYVKYNDVSVKGTDKINLIRDMIRFFKQTVSTDKFSAEIVPLLEEQIDLLNRGLGRMNGLQSRVHQRICHFLQYAGTGLEDGDKGDFQTRYDVPRTITSSSANKTDLDLYWNLLLRLRNDEFQIFRCFWSVCFKITPSEFTYLIRNIWKDTPITHNDRSSQTNQWLVTRWNVREEWTPWNCVLITKPYVMSHLKADNVECYYDASILSTVKNNHIRAKIHFQKLLVKNEHSHEF